jgi:phosphopantothenoylcysteine decarboxylase/phosphopantothenate--cysteine ligase
MGHALAQAAIDAGAQVTLITTATDQPEPYGAHILRVQTAGDMRATTVAASQSADGLIMAAAVSDFRPRDVARSKIKKTPDSTKLSVELVRNADIVASITHPGLIKIGFAAETESLLENAAVKLREKGLAMIVANDAESTIGADASTAHFLFADRAPVSLPRLPKEKVAELVIVELVRLCQEASGG